MSGNVGQQVNAISTSVIVDEEEGCSDAVKQYLIEATPYDTPGD